MESEIQGRCEKKLCGHLREEWSGRENRRCKGPGAGMGLACSREARMRQGPIAVMTRRGRERQKSPEVWLRRLVCRGPGVGGSCTSYVCMDRLLFRVTRSPKTVSGRGSIWFLFWHNHIKTWSLWTAPHAAVQRPSPPASSLDINWKAAEVQLSKMINRIISWGGGGQALIMQAHITLGLLILTHPPARGAPKIPEVTALINVVLLKLLAKSSMILTWT